MCWGWGVELGWEGTAGSQKTGPVDGEEEVASGDLLPHM